AWEPHGPNGTSRLCSNGDLGQTRVGLRRGRPTGRLGVEQLLAPDPYRRRGLDADTDLLSVYGHDRDHNAVPDHNPFPDFPIEDQHANSSLIETVRRTTSGMLLMRHSGELQWSSRTAANQRPTTDALFSGRDSRERRTGDGAAELGRGQRIEFGTNTVRRSRDGDRSRASVRSHGRKCSGVRLPDVRSV